LGLRSTKSAQCKPRHGGKAQLSAAWVMTVGHRDVSEFLRVKECAWQFNEVIM
jgi:hypothetical protein